MNVIKNYKDIGKVINKELVMIVAKTHSCSSCQTIANILETNLQYFHEIEKYEIKKFEREVKAATYHNISIKNKNGAFATKIIFDL